MIQGAVVKTNVVSYPREKEPSADPSENHKPKSGLIK
ncbi:hypothetical protein OOU_Y34scaffold00203g12 [Pyricularia oryzae Y34]|uniref:Uncharacterized protein n=2 Tax=Pyricularia oryzae TaxID=318829 RepID=A0AA97P5R8_PYRO3|nr:hypothetical protein OOU_Y34scaffold00203g12 [Pyricularia oryzae Y34]